MERTRRKSNGSATLGATGLQTDVRGHFRGMFHSRFAATLDEGNGADARDGEHAINQACTHGAADELHDSNVTVLGDYINHHAKERRHCTVKSRRTNGDGGAPASELAILSHHPWMNHLLGALDPVGHAEIFSHLELVTLPLGFVVCQAGSRMDYVYFPTTAIVSNFYELESGASAEISVIGNEGLVGIALIMGGETTTSRAVVRNAGLGYRLEAELLKRAFESDRALRGVLLRYTQALITQMAQIAVCNCHHNVEQQLCRLLLFSLDRLGSNEMALTQELIASLLGVRRESVTEVAGKLQAAGLIRYNRGHITVLDRGQMEARVCECYGVVKSEFDRLLPRHDHGAPCADSPFGFTRPRPCIEPLRRRNHEERAARRLA